MVWYKVQEHKESELLLDESKIGGVGTRRKDVAEDDVTTRCKNSLI